MPYIVFLDDDPRFLSGMRRALNKHKREWNLEFVTSAEVAFSRFDGRRIDILVSDHDMPGVKGDTVMETVRHRWPSTVRVMLTGRPIQSVAASLMGVAHRTFSKPCNVDQLAQYLSRTLNSARALKNPLVADLISGLSMPPLPRRVMLEARQDHIEPNFPVAAALYQLTTSHLSSEGSPGYADDRNVRLALAQLRTAARGTLPPIENPIVDGLWDEALAITESVRQLSRTTKLSPSKQRELTVAGPYSNVGSIALAEVLPGTYARSVGSADAPERWELEKAAFGASGLEVGAFLLTAWGFPESIVDEVRSQFVTLETMVSHSREVRVLAAARDRSWPEAVDTTHSPAA